LLWIKGDPGKGKTMLLCGIIEQLDTKVETPPSFFFCRANDPKLSNAHAVLRSLIYMVVTGQPSLFSHMREKMNGRVGPEFGDAESWPALCNIFLSILCGPSLKEMYVIIDALDECVQDQDKLLKFILHEAKSPRVKWLISSRHNIEHCLRLEQSQSILVLEDQKNAKYISQAVEAYITRRTSQIESLQDDCSLQAHVQHVLREKAEGTFLWVALVVQELENVDSWRVRDVVDNVSKGLDDLYMRMIDRIEQLESTDTEYCRLVLSAATLAYRPLHLLELGAVSGLPDAISNNIKNIHKIVNRSGSFLTVHRETVDFVHQSAKDYLVGKAASAIFPSGFAAAHRRIVTYSLQIMTRTLRRDIYDLRDPGTPIHLVQPPDPDPLAAAGYSCIYWVGHLEESRKADTFVRVPYCSWLQTFSFLLNIIGGILVFMRLARESQVSRLYHALDCF
jgi:hypothetical protein